MEGIKETEGKLDYSEINLEMLDLMAKRFNKNKDKYPKGNSRKPLDKTELIWAIFRHTRKILKPIKNDPENIEDHLSAIGCNLSMVLDQIEIEKNEQKELSKSP